MPQAECVSHGFGPQGHGRRGNDSVLRPESYDRTDGFIEGWKRSSKAVMSRRLPEQDMIGGEAEPGLARRPRQIDEAAAVGSGAQTDLDLLQPGNTEPAGGQASQVDRAPDDEKGSTSSGPNGLRTSLAIHQPVAQYRRGRNHPGHGVSCDGDGNRPDRPRSSVIG